MVDRTGETERFSWLPPYPMTVRDTVGAGDAFCGALAARIAAGASLIDAARYANAAGALATTVPGAVPAMPHDATIRALLGADTSSTGPDSENMPHSPFE